ncbi:acyl-CoA N-acyltransferase [Meredithblackwellia eburnea MCA 4105]
MGGHKLVKAANKASVAKLVQSLLPSYPPATSSSAQLEALASDNGTVALSLFTGLNLPPSLKDWAFRLFEGNMKELYDASADGYDPREKRRELFDPNSRFVVMQIEGEYAAYGIWRFDTEETMGDRFAEVVYCYEVQVAPSYQGRGLGRLVMNVLEAVGKAFGMGKVMLTVFKANTSAVAMYRKAGYQVDEISPSACGDQGADYEIMSKPCQ